MRRWIGVSHGRGDLLLLLPSLRIFNIGVASIKCKLKVCGEELSERKLELNHDLRKHFVSLAVTMCTGNEEDVRYQ